MRQSRTVSPLVITLTISLASIAGAVDASPLNCVVPTSVTLDVLPAGCAAVLTNGPITFAGVHASNGDTHNVEIDSLLMFGMNIATTSAETLFAGVDHDLTAGTTSPFSVFLTNMDFETSPTNNTYAVDSGTHTFGIAHFINAFGPACVCPFGSVNVFKLNFGEAGRPDEHSSEKVTSSGNSTTNPGFLTISSFFDVFTELSLDGAASFTVADNDFVGSTNTVGTGATLQLVNQPVPEPATLTLTALGLAGVVRRYRRGRSR